jgi:hypothetical protein
LTASVTPVAGVAPGTPVVAAVSSPFYDFCSAIKINLNDYVKFKEDSQWRTFNHQLQATAASHDTMDILNPSFTPSANDAVAFKSKQRFMYNVFSQCILTTWEKSAFGPMKKTLMHRRCIRTYFLYMQTNLPSN